MYYTIIRAKGVIENYSAEQYCVLFNNFADCELLKFFKTFTYYNILIINSKLQAI